jgi:antitoxin component of MazEF toxin-antitoxin module
MRKKLIKHGNSLALIIDKPILELLRIDADTPLEVATDGSCLMLSPVRDEQVEAKFQEAVEMVHQRFGRAMKKLAE